MSNYQKISCVVALLLLSRLSFAQLVTVDPPVFTVFDDITLLFDVKQSEDSRSEGLLGQTNDVYLWAGAWDNNDAFIYGPTGQDNFSEPYEPGTMTFLGNDVWSININPKEYFNIPDGEEGNITRLGLLLKRGDGINDGQTEDVFAFVNQTFVILEPTSSEVFTVEGDFLELSAGANGFGDWKIEIDDGCGCIPFDSVENSTSIESQYEVTGSTSLDIKFIADFGTAGTFEEITSVSISVVEVNVAPLPAGVTRGINYDPDDDTRVVLNLLAPFKKAVYAVGEWSDFDIDPDYLMNVDPDGENFWIELTGLEPGKQYVFQYWVDGDIKIGDPYADMVSDPWNDEFIPSEVHPNIPANDRQENAIATVIETGQTPYEWSENEASWERPPQEDLVIYELLVRDFIGSHYYGDLIDSLSYLKSLGINAIELMPIMEFEGNESWGYNPMYFFAPDKYYGSNNDLKAFIDAAHQGGIAVILDMVLNHAFGLNSMVRMYWDPVNNKPSEDSPWFNPDATHPFNVGYDFNHESQYTKDFVDDVNLYWIEEYHFDGYRFDLSKGFTQNTGNAPDDQAAWDAYDQSRVDILNRMADVIWELDETIYISLEHLGVQEEEDVLAENGMILWGNLGSLYHGAAIGSNSSNVNFERANNLDRVSYIESHDEQRFLYEIHSGPNAPIDDLQLALDRIKLAISFFYTLPGPKMKWQFQELGYDIDINFNGRTGNKPLPWGEGNLGYYEDPDRFKLLQTHEAIMNFVAEFRNEIDVSNLQTDYSSDVKSIVYDTDETDIVIVGNFSTTDKFGTPGFTLTGTWYDYFAKSPLEITSTSEQNLFEGGEFRIYTSVESNYKPADDLLDFIEKVDDITSLNRELEDIKVYPNPVEDYLQVQFSNELPRQIELFNSLGLKVYQEVPKSSNLSIPTEGLKTGLYFLRISNDNSENLEKIIIK